MMVGLKSTVLQYILYITGQVTVKLRQVANSESGFRRCVRTNSQIRQRLQVALALKYNGHSSYPTESALS